MIYLGVNKYLRENGMRGLQTGLLKNKYFHRWDITLLTQVFFY